MTDSLAELAVKTPRPAIPRPIVFIGAGGIVADAHIPAYRALGLEIVGVYDIDHGKAHALAERFGIGKVFPDLSTAFAKEGVVFDIAVPPDALPAILDAIPAESVALIQKPFGVDLSAATALRETCRKKRLTAAVNFQLRYAPNMLALAELLARGSLGRIVEMELLVNCRMPWELWPFLEKLPRMELALHSIHYLDLFRSILGDPRRVYARTVKHPRAMRLASSRSTVILDYKDDVRAALSVNHHHLHGPKYEESRLRIEGEAGAAVATIGVNLDYPRGRPDRLDVAIGDAPWREIPILGNWFPDAFGGTMSALMRFASGETDRLPTSYEDAWKTMALVETCYVSDASGGTPLIGESR